jgi:hypothetical protein
VHRVVGIADLQKHARRGCATAMSQRVIHNNNVGVVHMFICPLRWPARPMACGNSGIPPGALRRRSLRVSLGDFAFLIWGTAEVPGPHFERLQLVAQPDPRPSCPSTTGPPTMAAFGADGFRKRIRPGPSRLAVCRRPMDAVAEEPMVRRLSAGGRWIRTISPAIDKTPFGRAMWFPRAAPPARRATDPGRDRKILWGGRRGMATSSLHLTMECRDAPAERLEQVPRRPGPK